jgi:hypothetical protein
MMKFAVEDLRLVEEEIDRGQFSLLRVDAFSTGRSLHDTFVTEETLKRTAKTILQKPFVFVIDERFADLGSHDSREMAGGFVPHNSRLDFKKLEDGRMMLSVDVLIWKRYSGKLIEYFERDGGKKGVSVEIEIFESRQDEKSGLLEILDYAYQAITGLGDMIQSAIPDAEAIMAFSKEYDEVYKMEFGSRYDDLDFTVPKTVKNAVKKALEAKAGSAVALAVGRHLLSTDKTTPERIRQMAKFFKRKNISDDDISFNLFGGKAGRKWALELSEAMDKLDSERLSYFADGDVGSESNESGENNLPIDNYLGIEGLSDNTSKEENVTQGGYEVMEKEFEKEDEREEEAPEETEQESADFNYAEIFADESFAEMFAEVEADEEDEEGDDEEKERYAKAKEEFGAGKNPAVVMSAMYSAMKKMSKRFSAMKEKMAKMAQDAEIYMSENADMKSRFAEQEEKAKEFAVTSFLKELQEKVVIPEDKLEEMKAKATEFSFAEIEGWKNHCKAFSFDFEVKGNKEESSFVSYALPYNTIEIPQTNNVWDKLN